MPQATAIVKGEGGAGIVFQYQEPSNSGIHHVIRVRKASWLAATSAQTPAEHELEREVWSDIVTAAGDLSSLSADVVYSQRVVAPLLGPQYVPTQTVISLPTVEARMYGATQGILMHDATLLPSPHKDKTDLHAVQPPSAPAAAPPTLAIELKPKFGSTVDCPTSQPEDARIKRNASRYRLHQLLKLQQGAIAHPNAYDPLDLFSGDGSRMEAALMALFEHPQNNLRVFIDGEAVAMPSEVDGPGRDGTCELGDRSCSVPSALAAIAARALLLPQTTGEDAWSPFKVLVESIRMILTAEGVLDHLLEMQKMCEHDVEGVHALYCHVLGGGYHSHAQDQGTASGEASGIGLVQEGERRAALQRLMEAPRSEAIRILRAYSIASTARDCSLMIALQRWCGVEKAGACASSIPSAAHARHQNRLQGEDPSYCGVLQHPESDIVLRYRVNVVDLDRKPLRKIPKHLVLDREIMATARQRQCGCVCMT